MRGWAVAVLGAISITAVGAAPPTTPHARVCSALSDATAQLEKNGNYLNAQSAADYRSQAEMLKERDVQGRDSILSGVSGMLAERDEKNGDFARNVAKDDLELSIELRREIKRDCP